MALDGIDVSTWQPANITKIVDYDFAIMKASEGTMVARNCDAQYQAAKNRGKLVGVYHFASTGDPITEADFFVKNVKGYVGEAILVLDLEAGALNKWGPAGAKKWLDRVYAKTGVRPILYVMGSAVSRFGNVEAAGYGLWIAHWTTRTRGGFTTPAAPSIGPWPFAAIHQYTDRGRLKGYAGDLDLNVFHGDRAAWAAYAAKGGKAPEPTEPAKPSTPKPAKLTVDGLLGPATITRWQEELGTPADGVISRPSVLTKAVQKHLNAEGARDWDGKKLKVDGLGLGPNIATAAGKTRTIWALQDYLGAVTDGILNKGGSPAVKTLQRRLNDGDF